MAQEDARPREVAVGQPQRGVSFDATYNERDDATAQATADWHYWLAQRWPVLSRRARVQVYAGASKAHFGHSREYYLPARLRISTVPSIIGLVA
jgi:hypothetical protein